MKKNILIFLSFVAIVFFWRIALHTITIASDSVLLYQPSFPYSNDLLKSSGLPKSIYSFANFDGVHYLTIVKRGYVGTALIQAFFPLYPVLILVFSFNIISPILVGQLLSLCFLGLFLFILHKLAITDGYTIDFKLVCVAVLLFPTSLYFAAVYAESLFLFLVVSSFLFARKKRWLLAVIFAGLASATKVVGIALVPALFIELLLQEKIISKAQFTIAGLKKVLIKMYEKKEKLLLLVLSSSGLIIYMGYLHFTFSDPLYFFHVQSEFGAGRQESIVVLPQVIYRQIRILLTYRPFDWKYFSYFQDLLLFVATTTVLVMSRNKVRASYLVFSLLAVLIPTLTGSFSSIPRYVLACFPVFIYLSLQLSKKKIWPIIWLAISGILLVINTILFVQGYWVA